MSCGDYMSKIFDFFCMCIKDIFSINTALMIRPIFIKFEDFNEVCEACECTPCDCGWGNY